MYRKSSVKIDSNLGRTYVVFGNGFIQVQLHDLKIRSIV